MREVSRCGLLQGGVIGLVIKLDGGHAASKAELTQNMGIKKPQSRRADLGLGEKNIKMKRAASHQEGQQKSDQGVQQRWE